MKKEIANIIKQKDSFLILSHVNPDGDSIGSQLALTQALKQLGKTVEAVHYQPVPELYQSLPFSQYITVKQKIDKDYEVIIFVECSSQERAGFRKLPKAFYINIDHHLNNLKFADINWINPRSSSTGEMLYFLFEELEIEMTPEIAFNIYIAILTDTGSFQYANTSPLVFSICSKLVEQGVNPAEAALKMYYEHPLSKIRLLAQSLINLEVDDSGKIAWLYISREKLFDEQENQKDTEGYVNLPLSIKGVEVAMLIKQLEEKKYRISLRSKGAVNVFKIATAFAGGGHHSAAGCYLEGNYHQVKQRILNEIYKHLPKEQKN
jgi:phosphoesterase RecJ-like protein